MKTKNLIIILMSIALVSCTKEIVTPAKNSTNQLNTADVSTTSNSTYGNWLKFDTRDEYISMVEDITYIFSESTNPDSVLDEFESTMEYESLRHYHNDTTNISSTKDTVSYILSPLFSTIMNKYGIYEIDDTIYVESPNNTFIITDGDDDKLNSVMDLFESVEVDENELPENVLVTRVYKPESGITKEEAIEMSSAYDHSFTRENIHTINGKRYKTVAVVHQFSRGSLTLYALETKYEIGAKRFGRWYYTPTNAHWLSLSGQSNYYVWFAVGTPYSFNFSVTKNNLTGIYYQAYSYYNSVRNAHPVVNVSELISTHSSHIHSTTKTIEIYETNF